MRTALRRTTLLLAGAGLAPALALAPTATASAGSDVTVRPALLQSTWYWHQVTADAPVAGLPGGAEPSGVPTGDLAAASRDGSGTPSKLPLLAFALPSAPAGSTVTAFSFTLAVDPAAHNVIPPDGLKLVARIAQRSWPADGPGSRDTVNAPPLAASPVVAGTPNAAGDAWTFRSPALAQAWFDDVNFGLGIVPASGYTTPFQVSFLPKVTAQLSYTPGTPATDQTSPVLGSGGSGPAPLASSLLGGGTLSLPSLPTGPDLAAVPAPALPAPAAPQVAGPAASPSRAANAAALRPISALPPLGLVLTGLALLALLVVVSLVLGAEPVPRARSRSRLADALRAGHRPTALEA